MSKRAAFGGEVRRVRWGDRQLLWLEQVARDPTITAFGVRVAVKLAVETSCNTGTACVSQRELAVWCMATKGGVKKAVRQLVERGHLSDLEPGTKRRAAVYRCNVHVLQALAAPRKRGQRKVVVEGRTRITLSGHEARPDGVTADAPSTPNGATVVAPSHSPGRRRGESYSRWLARIDAGRRERDRHD